MALNRLIINTAKVSGQSFVDTSSVISLIDHLWLPSQSFGSLLAWAHVSQQQQHLSVHVMQTWLAAADDVCFFSRMRERDLQSLCRRALLLTICMVSVWGQLTSASSHRSHIGMLHVSLWVIFPGYLEQNKQRLWLLADQMLHWRGLGLKTSACLISSIHIFTHIIISHRPQKEKNCF